MYKRNYLKSDRSAWVARRNSILLAAGVLLAVYLLVTRLLGDMGAVKHYRMKARYHALTEEIDRLKRDNARLRRDVSALRSDPDYLERIARDRLGLAREGEIVYNYEKP